MVGSSTLPVAAMLTREPDRGVNFFSLAPRLMMHLDDVEGATASSSSVPASRYHLLLPAGASGRLRPTGNGWKGSWTRVSGWKMPAMPAEIRSAGPGGALSGAGYPAQ